MEDKHKCVVFQFKGNESVVGLILVGSKLEKMKKLKALKNLG